MRATTDTVSPLLLVHGSRQSILIHAYCRHRGELLARSLSGRPAYVQTIQFRNNRFPIAAIRESAFIGEKTWHPRPLSWTAFWRST